MRVNREGGRTRNAGSITHMVAKLIFVRVLDLVKVILVQLPDEGGKVGVFKHPGEDRFCEFIHILDDEAVAPRGPTKRHAGSLDLRAFCGTGLTSALKV